MTTERKLSEKETPLVGRRLIAWPLALIGLTLAVLFVANTVSAWGRGDVDDLEDIKSHAEHFIGRALDRLDATDEQSAAIQTIVGWVFQSRSESVSSSPSTVRPARPVRTTALGWDSPWFARSPNAMQGVSAVSPKQEAGRVSYSNCQRQKTNGLRNPLTRMRSMTKG